MILDIYRVASFAHLSCTRVEKFAQQDPNVYDLLTLVVSLDYNYMALFKTQSQWMSKRTYAVDTDK